jgi:phosphatidylserine/phosphatidylglycerophosphate/cardiolipin synthase-like enzyme
VTNAFENKFEALFNQKRKAHSAIFRGRFQSLAHSKVFIQKRTTTNKAIKVLTGSTNFSTNGLYINANHVLVFSNKDVAGLYAEVFDASFGPDKMKNFHSTNFAMQEGRQFSETKTPEMTIRFSPHTKEAATTFFAVISDRINHVKTDVLFAIMKDDSESSILKAIKAVRDDRDDIFSYGITDTAKTITLYKPHTRRGVRVAGKGGAHVLPPPFNKEAPIPGIAIHHKFVVVDFRGREPVLYCGSSNLAFGPEQKNGDNLIEIRDPDAVTVFAIEAIRLVDHFAFRHRTENLNQVNLHATEETPWYASYYDPEDLHFLERTLLIGERKT